jgi:hypothetical protein
MPLVQPIEVGRTWKKYRLALSAFGTDGKDVTGLLFAGGPRLGRFAIELDEVELRP